MTPDKPKEQGELRSKELLAALFPKRKSPWYDKAAGPMLVVICMIAGHQHKEDLMIITGIVAILNYVCHWRS